MKEEKDRYTLEDEIMNMYKITDDLNFLYDSQDELTDDEVSSILLSTKRLGELRIKKLYDTFREVLQLDEFYVPKKYRNKDR